MTPDHEEGRPCQSGPTTSITATQHGTRPGDIAVRTAGDPGAHELDGLGAAPFQRMPDLTAEQYDALRSDIANRGIIVPIVVDQHGRILDGHNRLAIATELSIDCPREVRQVADDDEAADLAVTLNCARRHLTREQVRHVIVAEIRRRPGDSDRAIARRVGCSPSTVGAAHNPEPAVSKLDTPVMSRDEAEQLTAKIKVSLTAAVTALDSLIYEALSNAIPAHEILAALTRLRRDFERDCQPDHDAEAGRLIAEAVFNPRFDYLLDPGTVDEWRPQWDHETFLPYTEDERSALLDAIGGSR